MHMEDDEGKPIKAEKNLSISFNIIKSYQLVFPLLGWWKKSWNSDIKHFDITAADYPMLIPKCGARKHYKYEDDFPHAFLIWWRKSYLTLFHCHRLYKTEWPWSPVFTYCDHGPFMSKPFVNYCVRYKAVKEVTFLRPPCLLNLSTKIVLHRPPPPPTTAGNDSINICTGW